MVKKRIVTELGPLILIADLGTLVYANWDTSDCCKKLKKIEKFLSPGPSLSDKLIVWQAEQQILQYFQASRFHFTVPLTFHGTPFQNSVWQKIREIEYGTLKSYSRLAAACGKENGCRAVASACGANPLAILVPCHRVRGTKSLGGYTGGIEKKTFLLNYENSLKPK